MTYFWRGSLLFCYASRSFEILHLGVQPQSEKYLVLERFFERNDRPATNCTLGQWPPVTRDVIVLKL